MSSFHISRSHIKELLQSYPILVPGLWLAAVPWLLFPETAPALTALSLLLVLILLFATPAIVRFSLPATAINSYLFVILLMTGAAYLLSPLPAISLPKLTVTFLGIATFYLILPTLNSHEQAARLISLMALSAGFVVLLGFFTLEWPGRQVIDLQPITDRLPHLSGSFSINFNEMAGTLLMLLPFVVAGFRQEDGRLKKSIYLFILTALLFLLLLTQSRSGLIGLLVIGLTWLLWGRISLRKIVPAVLVLALLFLLVFILTDFSLSNLFDWLSILDAGSKQGDTPPTSWLTRLEIWQIGGQILADYPVLGSGLYTFDPVSRANYVYETILPSFNMTHAHNLFVQTGTSLGIPGLLALLALWLTVIVKLWQVGRSEKGELRSLSAVFGASIFGYLFFNLFDTITFGQKPSIFVWMILAGSIGLTRLVCELERNTELAAVQSVPRLGKRLVEYSPFILLVILLFSPALPRNLANLRLDKAHLNPTTPLTVTTNDFPGDARRIGLVNYLAGDIDEALKDWRLDPQGGDYLQSQGTIALMAGSPGEAISWYNLALQLEPGSAQTYLWRGSANEGRGTVAMAEADFHKAVELAAVSDLSDSSTAYMYFRLGVVLRRQAEWRPAAEAFFQATRFDPEKPWYFKALGDALTALGDQQGAAAAYEKVDWLTESAG